jgi:hypothetical protein
MNDFFATLYEAGSAFHLGDFSMELYTNKIYFLVGVSLFLSVILLSLVFYYVIDHPRFNKWTHWLLFTGIVCLLNFGLAFYFTYAALDVLYSTQGTEMPYGSEFWIFSLINLLYAFLLSILVSLAVRWWSRNCSTCPIPN